MRARTEEQRQLAATVRALLDRHADSAAVRTAIETAEGYDTRLWRMLCDQVGVAALPVPEEHGGAGATLVETGIVLEELGRSLAPTPLLANAIEAVRLLLADTTDNLAAVANGAVRPVDLGTVVLEPAEPTATLDPTQRLTRGSNPPPTELLDVAGALISALQVGAMQRGLEMTVAYSLERVQFGRPIGSFQALKHRMADMLVLVESSRSASWAAIDAAAAYVAAPEPDRAGVLHELAAVARAYCSDASARVASETVQLHGGIAITWEHDAHLVFKRIHALNAVLSPAHRARAELLH